MGQFKVVGVFGILVSFFLSVSAYAAVAADDLPVAKTVVGEVFANGKKVKEGDFLSKGTLIEAKGAISYVDIEMQGHKVRIRNGRLRLMSLDPANIDIELMRGEIHTFVKKLRKNRKFRVRTKASVMGVRGTKFFVKADDKNTYLCVCEGEVEMRKGDIARSVKKGEDLTAKGSAALGSPAKAGDDMWKMAAEGFKDLGEPLK